MKQKLALPNIRLSLRKAGESWYTTLEARLLVSITHPADGESIVPYDRSSCEGGGSICQGSSSCSFALTNVGLQSKKNEVRRLMAAPKKSMKPIKASHVHPRINPSASMITAAAPSNTGRRYRDGFLVGLLSVGGVAMVAAVLSLTCP